MPLPIVGGVFVWLVGLVTSSFTAFATWLIGRMVFEKAVHYALMTAFIVAAGALFVTLSLTIKALIFAAQFAMPNTLGLATYFLPKNVNLIFSTIVVIRVSMFLHRWTVTTMHRYIPLSNAGYSGLTY